MNYSESVFEFIEYKVDLANLQCNFYYGVTTQQVKYTFKETIYLPFKPSEDIPQELLNSVLSSLHIILGISYWKAFCSQKIVIKNTSLSKEQAEFWNTVYTKGLGEFFYKNSIDFHGLVAFPFEENTSQKHFSFPRKQRSLVGIGGGKDSVVSAELMKKDQQDFTTFLIETQREHVISKEIAEVMQKELLVIKRRVDPQLFELNKNPQVFNGHIPISAVFAFIGILTGVLYDYSYVVVSNERSANYGNTDYLGETINHQWSKTIEFERLFQQYVATYITPDVTYFSLLRPYSEYKITKLFAAYPQYFSTFSSCNRNYAIQKDIPHTKWCGICPKCAFVFIMLSAFLPKEQIISIFGKNVLEDDSLVHIYKELLGIEGVKPFECVGTPDEVALAFYKVSVKGEYSGTVIMNMFEKEVLPKLNDVEKLEKEVLEDGEDLIPKEFENISYV